MEVLRPGGHEDVGPLKHKEVRNTPPEEAAAPAGVDEPEEVEEPLGEHPPVRVAPQGP